MKTKHLVFQTGRHYGGTELPDSWRGQVISAEISEEAGRIRFYDISRGLRGEFTIEPGTETGDDYMKEWIMTMYDNNLCDLRFSGDQPHHEIENELIKHAVGFDNTAYLEDYNKAVIRGRSK